MSLPVPLYLGCPAWSCREWIGPVFQPGLDPRHLLRDYSRLFNTVEGNTLFYALPPLATVERWMAESDPSFRFAPKFPKAVSHDHRLAAPAADEDTAAFLRLLETLAHGQRLGVSFLQLPPSFNANSFDTLARFLRSLPRDFRYALEPRHISWYDKADNEKALDELLASLAIDKVIFDSRPLFAFPADDPDEHEARERKPQTPVRPVALAKHPVVRFVARNALEKNEPWIKEWAPIINKWILEGRQPYVFAHAADDAHAPFVARRLHQQIRKLNPLLPPLPDFPGVATPPTPAIQQLDLF